MHKTCLRCRGFGYIDYAGSSCPACNGTGRIFDFKSPDSETTLLRKPVPLRVIVSAFQAFQNGAYSMFRAAWRWLNAKK